MMSNTFLGYYKMEKIMVICAFDSSKIGTVMAILTQIVPCQNINAHKQTKN